MIDAAITISSVLSVVQNNMCGLGGDMFALVRLNDRVFELNSSGRAAGRVSIDYYKNRGFRKIPSRGPLAAVTVPGLVKGWGELAKKFGSRDLFGLLKPAIDYSRDGFPITEKYRDSIRNSLPMLGEFKNWRAIFLPEGVVPARGHNLKQKDLSTSLLSIAQSGADDFYNGSLSEKISKGIEEQGGVIGSDDLRKHESTWVENPISTDYRGVKIYETSPNSQAATVLLWLNMLETFDLSKMRADSKKFLGVMVDTCLRAYRERARSIGDPSVTPLPANFTSKRFAEELLAQGQSTLTNFTQTRPKINGDTTYFAVADSEGNCASVIQSNYMGFGSGLVPSGTGIVLHNRGCYFSLNPKHHNSLSPGKRTFHTLCASLGEKNGELLFAIGSMGGDVQPQIHAQIITQVLDFGSDLQRAIDKPRWIIPMTIYEQPSRIYTESDFSELASKNLRVESLGGLSSQCGHAQAIYKTPDGLFGAADPRGDGASVGF